MRIGPAALAACVAFGTLTTACRRADSAEQPLEAKPPAAVAVSTVMGVDEPVIVEATGSFQADESSDVAPESSGRVAETPVDVGQHVAKGTVLIRIQGVDANLRLDDVKAAVARADANVKLAESQNALTQTTAKRTAALLSRGLIPETVADEARTQAVNAANSELAARASLAQARAQLALAEKAVSDVVVVAPFAGYISQRRVSVGEFVQPSSAVVTLLRIDPLRLQLTIPSVQASQIRIGQPVTARVDAFPEKVFDGKISALSPLVASESRSLLVEARVPNPGGLLKPGMFAVASIDQGRTARALLVPKRAVVEDVNTNSFRVFVVDQDNRARLRVVQLAARQNQPDTTKILTGLKEGERVATTSLADLYDGAVVTTTGAGDG